MFDNSERNYQLNDWQKHLRQQEETKTPNQIIHERLLKLEDIIYGNKLYVKCSKCDGIPINYVDWNGNSISSCCGICEGDGYIEVKIKDDGK